MSDCRGRRAASLLLTLVAATAFAGCGGDADDAPSPELTTSVAETDQPTGGAGRSADGEGGVELTELGRFDSPVYVTQPPGEDEDLYVVEQGGTIQRVSPDGSAEEFLDVSDEVTAGGEQGLLSVAFAPDYERSRLLYVYFTDLEEDQRVVEYEAGPEDVVDEGTRRDVLLMDDRYPNHNGGLVLFGPDGHLYIGTGDVGGGGDPERNALDLGSPLGKILRIDPRADGEEPYSIPPDNPFADDPDARGEVYALGLRNPWRFSFDAASESLSIGDVGQDEQEEIDIVALEEAPGANFGWSAYEGDTAFNDDQSAPGAIEPVLLASHEDGNCSITGGLIVRDPDLPSLAGRYLWGDFCLGELRSFTAEPGRPANDDRPLGLTVPNLSSFGTDNADNVYAVSLEGQVFRLDPAG